MGISRQTDLGGTPTGQTSTPEISSQRSKSEPATSHRKTKPPGLSIAA
jgi:hypothetical protein